METIYSKNHLELVFAKRNQLYGAYIIRQQYEKRLLLSFLLSAATIFALVSIPLVQKMFSRSTAIIIDNEVIHELQNIPVDVPVIPEAQVPEKQSSAARTENYSKPVVTSEATDQQMATQAQTQSAVLSNTSVNGTAPAIVDVTNPAAIEPVESPSAFAEVMPAYEGGMEELYRFISKEISYPVLARENRIAGTVHVSFVVEKDGSISSVKALNSVAGGCTEEAVRVVGKAARWSAGMQNGKKVRVLMVIPIRFSLK